MKQFPSSVQIRASGLKGDVRKPDLCNFEESKYPRSHICGTVGWRRRNNLIVLYNIYCLHWYAAWTSPDTEMSCSIIPKCCCPNYLPKCLSSTTVTYCWCDCHLGLRTTVQQLYGLLSYPVQHSFIYNGKQHNLIENITRSGGRTAVFMDGRTYITHCSALCSARAHWWQHRQKSIFNPFTHCLFKVVALLSIEYNITLIHYVCYVTVQIRESQQRRWVVFLLVLPKKCWRFQNT